MAHLHLSISINTSDPAEAADILARLEGVKLSSMADGAGYGQGIYAEAATKLQASNDPGANAPVDANKRTRRTKEQIAADNAAAAARGGTRDLAEQIAEVQAEETAVDLGLGDGPAAAAPTIDDVKAAMTAHMGKHSAKKTQDVLLATTGAGMISAIPAEKYAAAIAALQADMG